MRMAGTSGCGHGARSCLSPPEGIGHDEDGSFAQPDDRCLGCGVGECHAASALGCGLNLVLAPLRGDDPGKRLDVGNLLGPTPRAGTTARSGRPWWPVGRGPRRTSPASAGTTSRGIGRSYATAGPALPAQGRPGEEGRRARRVRSSLACAGTTRPGSTGRPGNRDQPRLRGEHNPEPTSDAGQRGPAPRPRGTTRSRVARCSHPAG